MAKRRSVSHENAKGSQSMIATVPCSWSKLAWIALLVVLAVGSFRITHADEVGTDKPANSQPVDANASSPDATPVLPDPEPVKKSVTPVTPIAPEKFRDVDDAAKLLIWLVVSCGLGLLVLLCVIVLGAKRMRRLTRSQMLKSKYDELEFLRLKHRREADGLPTPEPPKTEIR